MDNLKDWLTRKKLKSVRSVPFLVFWRVWIARNECIFESRFMPSFQVSAQAISLLSYFQVSVKDPKVRFVSPPEIDKTTPWGYFDSASQQNGMKKGGGYVLFSSDTNFFAGSAFLGQGSNNRGELTALLLLMKATLSKGYTSIQIFGDLLFSYIQTI